MPRKRKKSEKEITTFSSNCVTEQNYQQRRKDHLALSKVKRDRKGKKFKMVKISEHPQTWIEKEIK